MTQITIPKTESHRIVELMGALVNEFPELTRELVQVTYEAKDGILITVEPLIPHHTQAQRGYYREWVRRFGEFCGTTPDETHMEMLCAAYGTEYEETRFGLKRRPVKRSVNATRIEYSLLIDTLIRVAAEMGFDVPPPTKMMDAHDD